MKKLWITVLSISSLLLLVGVGSDSHASDRRSELRGRVQSELLMLESLRASLDSAIIEREGYKVALSNDLFLTTYGTISLVLGKLLLADFGRVKGVAVIAVAGAMATFGIIGVGEHSVDLITTAKEIESLKGQIDLRRANLQKLDGVLSNIKDPN